MPLAGREFLSTPQGVVKPAVRLSLVGWGQFGPALGPAETEWGGGFLEGSGRV